ncbi:MAG: MFS transporter [Alphaproteobacteria bacterium]
MLAKTTKTYFDRMIMKTIAITIFINTLILFTLSFIHINEEKSILQKEVHKHSMTIGTSIVDLIETALNFGVPFENLVEVEEFLNNNIPRTKEFRYVATTDHLGNLMYHSKGFQNSLQGSFKRYLFYKLDGQENLEGYYISGFHNIPIQIKKNDKVIGYLHYGTSQDIEEEYQNKNFYDMAIILFISIVIGFECLIFIFNNSIVAPISNLVSLMKNISSKDYTTLIPQKTKDSIGYLIHQFNRLIITVVNTFHELKQTIQQMKNTVAINPDRILIVDDATYEIEKKCLIPDKSPQTKTEDPLVKNLRLPAFLIVLSETILVAILPIYAAQFHTPNFGIPEHFISGTPIIIFMLFAGFGIPLSILISGKIGFQKTLLLGTITSFFGYLLCFFTNSLSMLLLTRALTAFGYGISYTSCQNYIALHSSKEQRIQSYTIFIIAFSAAYICGAPIGGILVDNIGFHYTFGFAAFTSILAFILITIYVHDFSKFIVIKERKTFKSTFDLFKLPSLLFVVLFAGLPTRLIFTSLITMFYPIYLSNYLDTTYSITGRIIMVFGIVSFVSSPIIARMLNYIIAPKTLLLISSVIIALALMFNGFMKNTIGFTITLGVYSIGSITHVISLMAILESIAQKESENFSKSSILTFYFIFERIGMLLGPLFIGLSLKHLDITGIMSILSSFIIVSHLVYFIYILFDKYTVHNTQKVYSNEN